MKRRAYLLFLGSLICASLTGCGVKQTNDTLVAEAGKELDIKASSFLDIDDVKGLEVAIDDSSVDYGKVGNYVVKASYKGVEYEVVVEVRDTKAPKVTLASKVVEVDDLTKLDVEGLVESVNEASGYETKVLGYEMIVPEGELSEKRIGGLETEFATRELLTEGLVSEMGTDVGAYRVVLSTKDEYENETLSCAYVVYRGVEEEEVTEEVVEETTETEVENTKTETKNDTVVTENTETETKKEEKVEEVVEDIVEEEPAPEPSPSAPPVDESEDVVSSGEELDSTQQALVNAGYYNVIVNEDGDYCVLVKDSSEGNLGKDLIREYLAEIGCEPVPGASSGSNVGSYGMMVIIYEIQPLGTEDEPDWGNIIS